MGATSIHNFVRALSKPYPGAEFHVNEIKYKLWKTELVCGDFNNIEPGKVLDIDYLGCPIVKCGDNAIKPIKTDPKIRTFKGAYI